MTDENTTLEATQQPAATPAAPAAPVQPAAEDKQLSHRERREAWLRGEQKQPAEDGSKKPEPAAEQPKDGEKKPEKYSERFAAMARQISESRRATEEAKAEREALAKERSEFGGIQELLKRDPLAGLERMGLTYNDLTKRVLSAGQATPADIAAQVEAKVRGDLEAREEAAKAEQAKAQAEQRVQQSTMTALTEISQVVTEGDFPFAQELGPETSAYQVIEEMQRHFAKTGEVLDYGTAIGRLETRLEEQHTRLGRAAAKKAAKLQTPAGSTQAPATGAAARPKADSSPSAQQASGATRRTLANADVTDVGTGSKLDWRKKRERFLAGQ
jgi:hypothetical protein